MSERRPAGAGPAVAFDSPDSAHMPAAYWFWHTLPSEAEIVAQVEEMDHGGFHAFQVQARLAYPRTEYLDTDYLRACRTAVEEAAKRRMAVGIYDEYNWQSGHAGGRTVAGRDDLRERHLFWARARVGPGDAASAEISGITSSTEQLGAPAMEWHYDGGVPVFDDWELVMVAHMGRSDVEDITSAAEIVMTSATGCTVRIDAGALDGTADVTVFCSARCATSRIPNYLLRETAERFCEVGCEPYAEALGDHLGTTVQYLFFDQPHANVYGWKEQFGNLRSSLPFWDGLPALAEEATGAPLARALLALLVDVGPGTASLRASFYDAFTERMCTQYLGTLRAWAERHGIALSGHEVLGHVGSWNPGASFSSWDLRTNFGLDHFRVDGYRHITGVDAQDCVAQLSTKLGDSVARSHGRSGCIVEQYMLTEPGGESAFAGHWGLSLEELRAQAIRLHLLGARQFLFHGFYQTDGNGDDFTRLRNPRFDFAPGINFEPWWSYHRQFADESGRLSVFLDGAAPICEVALFYPLRTAWAEGAGHSWGQHLAFWAQYLAEHGFGYHLVDEAELQAAEIVDGQLVLGDRRYRSLVLPSVTTLRDEQHARVLATFAAAGGHLVATGDIPRALQTGSASALAGVWEAVSGSERYRHLSRAPTADDAYDLLAGIRRTHPHTELVAVGDQRAGGAPEGDGEPNAGTEPDAAAGPIWQWIGQDEDAWRVVLFNDSRRTRTAWLVLPFEHGVAERWLPEDGDRLPWARLGGQGRRAPVKLRPMELCCFRVRPVRGSEELAPAGAEESPSVESVTVLEHGWTLELPDAAPTPVAVDRGWEQQGFSRFSGVGRYRTTVELERPFGATLVLPAVHCAAEVRWNGTSLGRRGWSPYEFTVPESVLVEGDNEVEVSVASSAANRYFGGTPFDPGPVPSGLAAPPVLHLRRPS